MAKFGTKIVLFGYFWVKTLKNFCHIGNQQLQISLIPKFCEKTKMPKFGRKSAFFGYFWVGILKNYCHIWIQHLWIWLTANYVNKQKCLNLAPKMPYLGIVHQECFIWVFLGKNKKKLLSHLKPAYLNLSNCKILWNNEMQKFGTKCALYVFF